VDIVRCNDWHTAMIPSYLASAASQDCLTQPATVRTIYNLVYQGPFTQRTLELLDMGSQNLSRLNDQKGIHLVIDALRDIMACNVQLIAMGVGDAKYACLFRQSMTRYLQQHFAYHATPNEGLARAIYAGCDLLLFPSIFEPCGLGPLIGLRYGAISVVRRTGGLAETIPDCTAEPH
jgi:glycogen synthase